LRLANQIKRRANAKQKLEENQQRELLSKQLEATLMPAPIPTTSTLVEPTTSYAAVVAGATPKATSETKDCQQGQNEAAPSDAREVIAPREPEILKMAPPPATAPAPEPDPTEHLTPHLVDTSEVAGQILQVSSIYIYIFSFYIFYLFKTPFCRSPVAYSTFA